MRCGRTFRSARTHPAPARLSGSGTLLCSRSLVDYAIDTHESEFSEASTALAETTTRELETAARTMGLEFHVLHASSEREIDTAFATLVPLRAGALVIGADALFNSRSEQLAGLALRHAVPAIYQFREFVSAGGLMAYGSTVLDTYRPLGVYTGRILKGEKPADLPVQQAVKVELIINLITAKVLGITLPPTLLARADEVIE